MLIEPMTKNFTTDVLMSFLQGFLLCVVVGVCCYFLGKYSGKREVQAAWQEEKTTTAGYIRGLEKSLKVSNEKHEQERASLYAELRQTKSDYKDNLDSVRRNFKQRLLSAEGRSEIYKRRAEGGTAECRNLAEHTAQLDRSLEEGRNLVLELRETIGLRERELETVGRVLVDLHEQITDHQGVSTK